MRDDPELNWGGVASACGLVAFLNNRAEEDSW